MCNRRPRALATSLFLALAILCIPILPFRATGISASATPAKSTVIEGLLSQKDPKSGVLATEQFRYPIRLGYQAATNAPEVMKQLFCYCGCDRANSHTSLLSCYLSVHSAYCPICQEEAIEAVKLKDKGATIGQIQAQIEEHYAKRYPFEQPSDTLKAYRMRLSRAGVAAGELSVSGKSAAKGKQSHACCNEHK